MKGVVILVAVLLIVVVGVVVFVAMRNPGSSGGNTQNTSGTEVVINNFAFSPTTLNVKVGDTVTWTNQDSVSHTVTSDSGSELASGTLPNGGTYSHTFNSAGTFDYHCSIHTSMKAKIIVS